MDTNLTIVQHINYTCIRSIYILYYKERLGKKIYGELGLHSKKSIHMSSNEDNVNVSLSICNNVYFLRNNIFIIIIFQNIQPLSQCIYYLFTGRRISAEDNWGAKYIGG